MNKNENIKQRFDEILKISNLDSNSYRHEIVKLYNSETENSFDSIDLSLEQENIILKWMNKSGLIFISAKHEHHLERNWFVNEGDKKEYLLQSDFCPCKDTDKRFFSIRIDPKSYNLKKRDIKNKYRELINTDDFVNLKNSLTEKDRICLKLVFVINKGKEKDIDNMAKITIDGLKKALFPDDKQIDHLELIKFKAKYLEDCISISISRSYFNNNNDIIFNDLNMSWGSRKKLEI